MSANAFEPKGRSISRWAVRGAGALVILVLAAALVAWRVAARSVRRDVDEAHTVAGLSAPVTLDYDRWGVPHVHASSVDDALFAQGYAHARDRFFQMELSRRAARGRLAELLGKAALPSDVKLRRWTLGRTAERQTALLDGESLRLLEAYARGVNAAIARHGAGGLAPELALLGGGSEPWKPSDTVGIGLLMQLSLTWAAGEELERAAQLKALGPERAADLWQWSEEQRLAWLPDGAEGAEPRRKTDAVLPPFSGMGSNNWAIAGRLTASGYPLVANDPHVGIANPSTWYEMHLAAPGFTVAGASIPGAPGVLIGHNESLAWGFTMVMLDDQDLFRLRLDPTGGREDIGGVWRDLDVREETISVRGGKQHRVLVRVSTHGPVVREEGEETLAMSWTALMGGSPLPCFLALDRAASVGEGVQAFASCESPAMNLVMGDRSGRIAWQMVGRVPLRGRGAGRVPLAGWEEGVGWRGMAPYESNPRIVDPPSGIVATANHDPFAEGDVEGTAFPAEFAAPWRVRTIRQALAARAPWDAADCLALQVDVANPQADAVLDRLADVLRTLDTAAARRLLAWDRRMTAESGEALLWAEFLRELGRRIGADEAAAAGLDRSPIGGDEVLALLTGSLDARWWDDVATPAAEGTREIVAEALEAAAARTGERLWGERHRVLFEHPLGAVPVLGLVLNVGPFAAAGAGPCLNAAAYSSRGFGFDVVALPSLRFVADLADWDRAVLTLPLGQSGHFLSPHVDDQVADWLAGRAHAMAWTPVAVAQASVATVVLRPAAGGEAAAR